MALLDVAVLDGSREIAELGRLARLEDPTYQAGELAGAFARGESLEDLKKWLGVFYRRFFGHQFKRSCTADAPKVGMVALSPRGDWRMPSDAVVRTWIDEVEAYTD